MKFAPRVSFSKFSHGLEGSGKMARTDHTVWHYHTYGISMCLLSCCAEDFLVPLMQFTEFSYENWVYGSLQVELSVRRVVTIVRNSWRIYIPLKWWKRTFGIPVGSKRRTLWLQQGYIPAPCQPLSAPMPGYSTPSGWYLQWVSSAHTNTYTRTQMHIGFITRLKESVSRCLVLLLYFRGSLFYQITSTFLSQFPFSNLLASGAGEVVDGTPDSPVSKNPGLELFIKACDVVVHIPALLSANAHKQNGKQMTFFITSEWTSSFVTLQHSCNTECASRWFLLERQYWFSLERRKSSSLCLWSAA